MGQGLDKLSTAQYDVRVYLNEFPGYALKEALETRNSRFLKAVECIHQEGRVLVKVYARRGESLEDLAKEKARLENIRGTFAMVQCRNLLAYQKVEVKEKAAIMARQFMMYNLYDRMGTRPFVNNMEKRWILFQLLQALQQCHHWGIAHGDITPENVLLTSWHWLYLADFLPLKPAYLPLDDPSDFTFYYNSSGRTAYIAPERFYNSNDANRPTPISCVDLPESADVFSLGCVAAELFLEHPLFDFSQLLAFREGKYDPKPMIDCIADAHIKQLVHRCVALDPKKRITVTQALREWDQPWMHMLHQYVGSRLNGDCDERVMRLVKDADALISRTWSPASSKHEARMSGAGAVVDVTPALPLSHLFDSSDDVAKQLSALQGEEAVYGAAAGVARPSASAHAPSVEPGAEEPSRDVPEMVIVLSAVCSSLRSVRRPRTRFLAIEMLVKLARVLDDEVRLERIVPYLLSLIGDAPIIRCAVIDALANVLGMVHHGEHGLFPWYVLPGIAGLSKDPDEAVRECFASRLADLATAAKRLLVEPGDVAAPTSVGVGVGSGVGGGGGGSESGSTTPALVPKPARPDPPRVSPVRQASDTDATTKSTSVEQKTSPRRDLLHSSGGTRKLDGSGEVRTPIAAATTSSSSNAAPPAKLGAVDSYDGQLHQLRVAFHAMVRDLLEDGSRSVKRRVLLSLAPLCKFFGRRVSTETFVPFLITFLSHSSWQLRCVAYQHLLGVMQIVGSKSLEDITVALIGKSFGDSSEHVIAQALLCCKDLIQAKLLRSSVMFDICVEALPLMLHCNAFVREAAVGVVLACWSHVSVADRFVFMSSALEPYLVHPVLAYDEEATVRAALRAPLVRDDLTVALTVAHDLHKKGLRPTMEQHKAALLGRLKVLGFSDAVAHSVALVAPWMQVHAEAFSAQQQQLEEQALEQKMMQKDAEPMSFPGINVVLDDRTLAPRLAARLSEEEYRQKYAHNATTLTSMPSVTDLVSPALDALHNTLEGGPSSIASLASASLSGGSISWSDWRPRGHLVANLVEHSKAVTSLTVSGDQRFFCSGSLDGTIRVWDSVRLHTIVTNRSRLTCKVPTGGVTCLTMLRDTHCVISGTSDGYLHLFNVAQTLGPNRVARYSGVHSVASHACHRPVVSVHDAGDAATLIYCTTAGTPQCYDLRARTQPHIHREPHNSHGVAVGMAVHPSANWACVASRSGDLTIWDMRFSLPVRTLQLGCGASCVFRHNDSSVIVATLDNTLSCVDVAVDCSRVSGLLLRSSLWSSGAASSSSSVAADFAEMQTVRSLHNVQPNSNWIIAGHDDTRLRYWDMARPAESYVIAGPTTPRFVYTQVHPPKGMRLMAGSSVVMAETPLPTNARMPEKSPPAGVVASSSQTPVYTGHRDSILQIASVAAPHPMLITASRDGVVKAWL